MKIYVYELRVTVSDIEGFDSQQYRKEIVAPDMELEQAIEFMRVYVLKEWPERTLQVRVDHVQKLYLLGCID